MTASATEEPRPPPRWLLPFRRVTTSGAFIAEIDGLRFLAIATVVLFHLAVGLSIKSPERFARPASSATAALAWNGFHGVELFFVISGFILAVPFAAHFLGRGKPVDLKQYFWRRVTRLEPPYVLSLALLFALHVLFRGRSAPDLGRHLLAGFVYLHNAVYGYENPINNVTWSLEIEIQFYVLTPLLAGVFAVESKRARRALIAGAAIAAAVLGWLFIEPGQRAYWSIARFLQFFLVGFLLADVFLTDWKQRPSQAWGWDAVSLLGWPAMVAAWNLTAPGQREPLLVAVGFPLALFFLYCAAFRGPVTRRVLTQPWLTTIGGMCYTIYLLHNPILNVALAATRGVAPATSYAANLFVQLLLTAPAVLVPSAVYFVLVERPCMRRDWPERLVARVLSVPAALGLR